ncbi:hypothetical protein ACWD4L_25585 [Streptomyces sp. NPDC002596]
MNAIAEEIAAVFAEAGAQGFLHVREVGVTNGPEAAVGADTPVVLASVFKIPVAVSPRDRAPDVNFLAASELCRSVAEVGNMAASCQLLVDKRCC